MELGLIAQSRGTTDKERELVRWLLLHCNEPDCSRLLDEVESLQVVASCSCGCPTVYFAVAGDPPTRKGERLVADFLATVDEQEVGVMLFLLGSGLSSLEVYSCGGTEKQFGLPALETLHPY